MADERPTDRTARRGCPRCDRPVGRKRLSIWFWQSRWPCPGCAALLRFEFETGDRFGQLLWLSLGASVAIAYGWLGVPPLTAALLLPVYLLAVIPFLRVRCAPGPSGRQ